MALPLMPKATAVWLVENTALTFAQISEFCGLHALEVQAIADGEVAPGMQGLDPIQNGQVSKDEIKRCEGDVTTRLEMSKPSVPLPKARQKGARYTPISKRQDRPDAIAWLLKAHPELSDAQISRLIGTTKPTINAIRDKTHRNMSSITPQSPIYLGLCTGADLETLLTKARARAGTSTAKKMETDIPDVQTPELPTLPNVSGMPEPTDAPSPVSESSLWENSSAPNSASTTEHIPSVDEVFGPKPNKE